MTSSIDVLVPNIGDFHDVPIVDVLVKPGDTVAVDDPIVTLESEKAAMEIPSPHAGVVQNVVVAVGDKVSEGSALLTIGAAGDAAPASESSPPAAAAKNGAAPVAAAREPEPSAGEKATAQSVIVELKVPDIGDFANVPVIEVLVAAGDRVEAETPLVTLESEKASIDVPAGMAGVIREVIAKVGDKVSQSTVLATLEGAVAAPPSASPSPSATRASAAPAPAVAEKSALPASDDKEPAAGTVTEASAERGVVHASPSLRRFARELGVDLHAVRGTGPRERITREDVQGFVKRALSEPAGTRAAKGAGFEVLPWPKLDFASYGPIERVPLSRIRKLSGPNLHRNWVMIPHVTNDDDADVTALEEFRRQLNAENTGAKVTMLAFAIKAVVAALKAYPDLNSSLDGDALVLKKYYNIGFAADTPGGLVVPVLKGADEKGVLAIASETGALAAKARDGKLALGDMQGATFTISSLGGIGGTSFTPIINAPEVAILGLSRAALRPVWDGNAFVPRLILPLSLSYDHRVIDGALAARFNAHLAKLLGDFRRALL